MRTKSPWSPGALLIVIGRTEEPQAEYCLGFLTFACDFLLAARLTRRRCTLRSLGPALRLLNGDVPTKSGADALKLIAVLKSQDGRAGLAVDHPLPNSTAGGGRNQIQKGGRSQMRTTRQGGGTGSGTAPKTLLTIMNCPEVVTFPCGYMSDVAQVRGLSSWA